MKNEFTLQAASTLKFVTVILGRLLRGGFKVMQLTAHAQAH